MCGIAGVCRFDGEPVAVDRLSAAKDRLMHRGPDGSGVWTDSTLTVGLAHTRLAIIDLQTGEQPLANEDDSLHVVFNGEIYNHVELRDELIRAGHRFRTSSDTEVLVHLYEELGVRLVDRLNGMFAFALWDERRRQLLLARDRLGKKPLFISVAGRRLAFASEIKGLFPLLDQQPAIDPVAIHRFLAFQYVPHHCCAFAGVEQVRPGERLVWSESGIQRDCYWSVPRPKPTFRGSFADAAKELRRLLVDAARIRLRSDVPIGVLLSGGIDSASVVGLMAEAGASSIRTYTAHFGDESVDERPFARVVSERFATDHHELFVAPPAESEIGAILDHYDEPFGDTSSVPTFAICREARRNVKVVLTGDGGDESFLGYDRYRHFQRYMAQRRWIRPWLALSGLSALAQSLPASTERRTWRRRFRTALTLWDAPPAEAYLRWLAAFMGAAKDKLYTKEFAQLVAADPPAETLVREGLGRANAPDLIAAAAAFDTASYLPDAVLTKVDRASMANGLECRSPLLDHRVVEFAATLRTEWKLHPRFGGKWILKGACRDLLPERVLHRKKAGFGAPVGGWFRRELKDCSERWCVPSGGLERWLDASFVRRLVDEHANGVVDHTYRLWTLASLNRFWSRFGS